MKTFRAMIALLVLFTSPVTEPQIHLLFNNYGEGDVLYMNRIALQRIFIRKDIFWPDGESIIVYTKPLSSIEHRDFVLNMLRMSLYNYQKGLEANTYAAKSYPPVELKNDLSMITAVYKNSGSIGYLNYEPVAHGKIIKILGY